MFKTPFKPIGHYVFNYKPRYYDERKERLQALEDRHQRESNENEKNEYSVTLSKNNLRQEWNRSRSASNADRKSTYRLALIIAILSGLALYILR